VWILSYAETVEKLPFDAKLRAQRADDPNGAGEHAKSGEGGRWGEEVGRCHVQRNLPLI